MKLLPRKIRLEDEPDGSPSEPELIVEPQAAGVCWFEFSTERKPNGTWGQQVDLWYLSIQPHGPWWYVAYEPFGSYGSPAEELRSLFVRFSVCQHTWGARRPAGYRQCVNCQSMMSGYWPKKGHEGMPLRASDLSRVLSCPPKEIK